MTRHAYVGAWLILWLGVLVIPASVAAQDRDAAAIAAELANPNTALGTMSFNFDYASYGGTAVGDESVDSYRMVFQPSLPVPLGPGLNLFVRPAVPLIFSQDVPGASGFESRGVDLADIGFDVALGKSFSSGFLVIGGLVGTLPTATDEALGGDQWRLGPEAAVAVVKPWGVVGVLVTHQWNVAGDDSYDTSLTGGQYFYTFNLQQGWQIKSGPTFAYDRKAPDGQRLTLPLGVGTSKTTFLGSNAWKFAAEYWYYVAQPDAFGPDWQIRFSVSPVVPLPW